MKTIECSDIGIIDIKLLIIPDHVIHSERVHFLPIIKSTPVIAMRAFEVPRAAYEKEI